MNELTPAFRRVWSRRVLSRLPSGQCPRCRDDRRSPSGSDEKSLFLLWGCRTFLSDLQLLAEVDSGRCFQLARLTWRGRGCPWPWSSSVSAVRCGCHSAPPPHPHVRYHLLVFIYKMLSIGSCWRDSSLGRMMGIVPLEVLAGFL